MNKSITYIYGLKDPRDLRYRYVGKTNNPSKRLKDHIEKRRVNELLPVMDILEYASMLNWQEKEKYWIALGFSHGWPLTNISKGGGGGNRKKAKRSDSISFFMSERHLKIYDQLGEDEQDEISGAMTVKMLPCTKCVLDSMGLVDEYVPGFEARIGALFVAELMDARGTAKYYEMIDLANREYNYFVSDITEI
jgi:hypothetical protein